MLLRKKSHRQDRDCFGSKAAVRANLPVVRSTPKNRLSGDHVGGQLGANSRLSVRRRATVRHPIINLPPFVTKQLAKTPFAVVGPSSGFV